MAKKVSTIEIPREFALRILKELAHFIDEHAATRWLEAGEHAIQDEAKDDEHGSWGKYLNIVLLFAQTVGLSERELIALRFDVNYESEANIQSDRLLGVRWTDANGHNPLYNWDVTIGDLAVTVSKDSGFGHSAETHIRPVGGANAEVLVPFLQQMSLLRRAPVYMNWTELGVMKVTPTDIVPVGTPPTRENYLREYLA